MANVQNYLPNLIAAVLIFVVGAALAGVVGGAAHKLMGDTPTGRIARAAGPSVILAIVVFMVLTQLKIAPTIVEATYIALIGMLALTGALAFVGGREVAADMLRNAYSSAQDNKDQVRQDTQTGRDRAQQHGEDVRTQTHERKRTSASCRQPAPTKRHDNRVLAAARHAASTSVRLHGRFHRYL